ncbi:hypothetical protein [Thetidibacter halocola]|uniref:Uncharacterized protein n=1 Tax=Thetidibacter halocola TaxID=2827239 RepID=A0A8J8B5R0_9RHOB|nr:hypothetical protein [Thetidibacter halocola]MBS0123196.1 hypothetical protein [Thetidibacter halocola]
MAAGVGDDGSRIGFGILLGFLVVLFGVSVVAFVAGLLVKVLLHLKP